MNRFWSKVDTAGDCWEWTACKTELGYGRVRIGGQLYKAHRVAWKLANGPIPEGLEVCHHCDNPPCVNPTHLFIGTHADNLGDSAAKGRMHRGERNWSTKLTRDDVRRIRVLIADGLTQEAIAARFGVVRQTVSGIATGGCWGWLE